MVVYQGAKPLKSAYRRFQIKELTGGHPDDYGSMREVLRRRLQRAADGDEKFLPLPDVFLIDGGVTHADAVREEPPEQGPLRLIDVVRLLAAQQEYMRQLPLADGRHELAEFHQQRPFPKSFFLIAL